jgi:beta-glucosidase
MPFVRGVYPYIMGAPKCQQSIYNTKEHQVTALKVAKRGIVLLTNDSILPVNKNVKIVAVIGASATHSNADGEERLTQGQCDITALQSINKGLSSTATITFNRSNTIACS